MKIAEITHCANSLNFKPRRPWPHTLPPMSWNGILLCGFSPERVKSIELADQSPSLQLLLTDIYPQLGLAELARLYSKLIQLPQFLEKSLQWNWTEYFAFYQFRYCESLVQCLETLVQTPESFQNWVDEKKVSPRELKVLLGLKEWQNQPTFLTHLVQLKPSRSQGIMALELGVELLEMNHTLESLLLHSKEISSWLSHLKQLRNPMSFHQKVTQESKIQQWPWPPTTSAHWVRRGDESGIEIKFLARSKTDLDKNLKGLENISKNWADFS